MGRDAHRRIRRIAGVAAAVVLCAGAVASAGGPDRAATSGSGGSGGSGGGAGHAAHPASANVPPAAPLRDGERFVHLAMPRPYAPSPPRGGTDDYRCFLVDPGFTDPVFVTGSQFLPDNAAIVHHAIFFRVEPDEVAEARALDEAVPGDGWTCFGGTGIGGRGDPARQLRSGGGWIAAWAPGGRETVLAARIGNRMEPGSQIAMQVHYSLLGNGGRPAGADRSAIRLRVAPGTAGLEPLMTRLLPAPVELPCAPGESGDLCDRERAVLDVWRRFGEPAAATVAGLNFLCNGGRTPVPGPTQQCEYKIGEAGTVHAVAGHMHLLGRSIKVELNPGTPNARTLLDVPVYNFDDQGARAMAEPVPVGRGDTLRVSCTHDVGLRAKLPELRQLQPRYVVWGDGTSDEMCLGIVVWSRRS